MALHIKLNIRTALAVILAAGAALIFLSKKTIFIFVENEFLGVWGFPQQAKYFANRPTGDL